MFLKEHKKIYFASDLHLGVPDYEKSLEREKLFVKWLDEIKADVQELFLLGDIFDFWFEYKRAVPRGFVRLLAKISELTEAGIPVHFFTGNHDLWVYDYLPRETGVIINNEPISIEINNKKFYIAHGDGLGPADLGFKMMKKVFINPFAKWLFARIHPNLGIRMASYWSKTSRYANGEEIKPYQGNDKERLFIHSENLLQKEKFDFFIYGHRHLPLDIPLGESSRMINLGDWLTNFTFAVFDGENLELKKYTE
jgi:UDP-2,3-diacylglucosamine hydrolase